VYNNKAGKGSMAMGKAPKGKKQAAPKKPRAAKGMKAK
jgi:hypothetical protein